MANLHFFYNIKPINNLSKNNMNPVKPIRFFSTQKELTSIGIGTRVCHRDYTSSRMLKHKIFICKCFSINAFAYFKIQFKKKTQM